MKTKKIIAVVLVTVFAFFSLGESVEAKNYRSRKSFAVTGDGSNADASIVYVGGDSHKHQSLPKNFFSRPQNGESVFLSCFPAR